MGHEHKRDGWLGTTLRQSPAVASEPCLDAETLAAWADGGLTASAAAAVDLHASNCARCMAVLAAMERTAPAAPARHAWATASLFRWLVPLTAAATAVAIWIALPDRPVTPVMPPLRTEQVPVPVPVPSPNSVPVPVQERESSNVAPRTRSRNAAPSTQKTERQAQFAQEQEQLQLRDEARRERGDARELGAAAGAAPAAEAPPSASPAPPVAAPPAAAATRRAASPPAASTDAVAETAAKTELKRSAFSMVAASTESAAPSNPLIRWRVIGFASIERSTDGGKTWARTTPPPGAAPNNTAALSVVAIRAVDANRAVVGTSDGTEFYTTNRGNSWTRVQENSAAPF